MKSGKILDLSFEKLVGETFNLTESANSNAHQLNYISEIKSYRLWIGATFVDFPQGLSFIDDLKKTSFIELKLYDKALNDGLKEVLNTHEDLVVYMMDEDIFIETKEYEEIKKAA
ncbi:hypothetical protein ACRXCV_00910 [Halobacteriovorax sp. GFR7]|uniref:hypothetical protein n=1 Tax=unclassified Halobacteriovorax TaxID=2639665 RepID=UPI00371EA8D0